MNIQYFIFKEMSGKFIKYEIFILKEMLHN